MDTLIIPKKKKKQVVDFVVLTWFWEICKSCKHRYQVGCEQGFWMHGWFVLLFGYHILTPNVFWAQIMFWNLHWDAFS